MYLYLDMSHLPVLAWVSPVRNTWCWLLVLVSCSRVESCHAVMSRCHVTMSCHVSCPVSCHVTYIQSDALYPVDGDWIWSAREIAAMGGCDAP